MDANKIKKIISEEFKSVLLQPNYERVAKELVNESREFVIIDPRGNARPVGAKSQGAQYIKKMGGPKKGYHMVLKKNALKARRAIEKNGGNATNSKIQNIMFDLMYEGKLNEGKRISFRDLGISNLMDLKLYTDKLAKANIGWDQKGQALVFNNANDAKKARQLLGLDEVTEAKGGWALYTDGKKIKSFRSKKEALRALQLIQLSDNSVELKAEGKLTEARKLSSSDKKAIAKVVDDAELSFMRLSSSETWMDDYSTEDMVKILVTKYNSSEYRKTSLRDLLDAYDVKKQKDNIYGWKDEMSEGKLTEGNNFNMVSAKFKDALDNASEISTDSVKKLIKKFKEKRPDAAMEYAKQAFGWMFKESKLTEGEKEALLGDPKMDKSWAKKTDRLSKSKLKKERDRLKKAGFSHGNIWSGSKENMIKFQYVSQLLKEGKLTEALARGLKPLLMLGSKITKKVGEDALLKLSDKFEDIDDEGADDIASHLNMAIELMQDGEIGAATKMFKQFNKKCKDVLKGKSIKSVFEGKLTEGMDFCKQSRLTEAKLRKGDFITQDDEIGLVNKVKGRVAYVKFPSTGSKSFDPVLVSDVKYKGKFKGKDLYIAEGKLTQADKYITNKSYCKYKVGDTIKLLKYNWKVTEINFKPGKSYKDSFTFLDGKQVPIKSPPTNKNAVGYKLEDGRDSAFYYCYKSGGGKTIMKLAIKGFNESVKEGKLNEMDMNDPILVAIRARKTMLAKAKAAPKTKKISMAQYYKLMDTEIDLINDIKNAYKEYERLDSDMNAEAGQKGKDWTDADANRYGGDLDKLQTKIEKLAKLKLAVKKQIMNYRVN